MGPGEDVLYPCPLTPSYHSLSHRPGSRSGLSSLFFSLIPSMSGSQTVVPGPAASASPGNLLEMHTLRTHPRETKPETQEKGSAACFLIDFPGDSDAAKV